jgi:hypothetical protein
LLKVSGVATGITAAVNATKTAASSSLSISTPF